MRLSYAILVNAMLWMPPKTWAHIDEGKIYCIDKDGSGIVRVSSGSGNVTGPTCNPAGSKILYVTTGEAHEGHDYPGARFIIIDFPGLESRLLDLPSGILGVRSTKWSPDGTRVAFVGRSATSPSLGHNDLYLMNLADEKTINLTNGSIPFIGMPTWSPDGTEIAFTTGAEKDWSLYVLEVDKPATSRKINMGEAFILNLSWSPDGTRFALQRRVEGNFEIYVMNADGTNLVNLSNHPSFDADPAWSPDGTEILFVSDRNGDKKIYRMVADGSAVTQLTFNQGTDVEPAWSSDGKICFVSDRERVLENE